jgi:hypothetical protein
MSTPPAWYPPITDHLTPEEIKTHLELIYNRLNNHGIGFQNVQNQIDTLKKASK